MLEKPKDYINFTTILMCPEFKRCSQYLISKGSMILYSCTPFLSAKEET